MIYVFQVGTYTRLKKKKKKEKSLNRIQSVGDILKH